MQPSGAAPLPDCMRSPRTPPPRGPPRDRARSPKLLVGTSLYAYAAFIVRCSSSPATGDAAVAIAGRDLCFDKLLHHRLALPSVVPIRKLYLHRRLAKRALWVAWLKAHLPERRERVSDSTKVVAREERERLVV